VAIATAPRPPYAPASAGEARPVLATVHPRFHTPVWAIIAFALLSWICFVVSASSLRSASSVERPERTVWRRCSASCGIRPERRGC
jgi:amino acid transporter